MEACTALLPPAAAEPVAQQEVVVAAAGPVAQQEAVVAAGDVLAGALIIMSCILTTLIVLLLVAAGVSTTLLVSLSTNPGPVEIEPWLADYGRGFGVQDLFRDRLNLLLGTRAADLRGSTVMLVRGARMPVAILEAAMLYFNFSKPTGR